MNQITGPQDASIHRPMAANGKNTASTTAGDLPVHRHQVEAPERAVIEADQPDPVEHAEQQAVARDDALEPGEDDLARRGLGTNRCSRRDARSQRELPSPSGAK